MTGTRFGAGCLEVIKKSGSRVFKVKHVLEGRVNAMSEHLHQAGERTQIRNPKEVNFSVLNAPYRPLSDREEILSPRGASRTNPHRV
jgi:hypothetical protein